MNAGPLRRAVALVAILNLAYFGVEFAVPFAIGSVSLFAVASAVQHNYQ